MKLDIGCGFRKKDRKHKGCIGIDINRPRYNVRKDTELDDFAIATVHALPFPDKTFDKIYFHAVIEHLPRGHRKAIREIIRVLEDDGIVDIIIPVVAHQLKYFVTHFFQEFPFVLKMALRVIHTTRKYRGTDYCLHVAEVYPSDFERFGLKIFHIVYKGHSLFMGRKGKLLRKLLNGRELHGNSCRILCKKNF